MLRSAIYLLLDNIWFSTVIVLLDALKKERKEDRKKERREDDFAMQNVILNNDYVHHV